MREGGEKKRRAGLTRWRWLSQVLFLVLFLVLFRRTDYSGSDELHSAVNIFFRWDPLVAGAAVLASKSLIALLLPAVAVAGLTALLGRFFCGWVCPLGTCLDAAHGLIAPAGEGRERRYRSYKYYLLIIILTAAAFGVPLVGFFDPFSLLVRGLTLALDPGLFAAASWPFDFAYQRGPDWLTGLSEPLYGFLKKTVLPYDQKVFTLALLSGLILALVFAFERLERRFWCRNLCPLGALLGLCARRAPLKMQPGRACKAQGCTSCIDLCRMRAIDDDGRVSPEACTLCLDCIEGCDQGLIAFKFKATKPAPAAVGLSRRGFASATAAGLTLPLVLKARAITKRPDPLLVRPPGALAEPEFLARCVRCGECMKVCINNALQPALLQAGTVGLFSPVVVSRLGSCAYNCTLCGQVCPTGAIARLPREVKQQVRIGRAGFDRDRCLPWAKGVPCLVCEEMCPLPDKAIKLREERVATVKGDEVLVKRPYVVDELCIGCGACENKCPLPGPAAVQVTSEAESRNPES